MPTPSKRLREVTECFCNFESWGKEKDPASISQMVRQMFQNGSAQGDG